MAWQGGISAALFSFSKNFERAIEVCCYFMMIGTQTVICHDRESRFLIVPIGYTYALNFQLSRLVLSVAVFLKPSGLPSGGIFREAGELLRHIIVVKLITLFNLAIGHLHGPVVRSLFPLLKIRPS